MVKLHVAKYKQIAFLSLLLTSLPSFCADDKEAVFHGESVRVLESAYRHAPRVVHKIVESLTGERKGSRCYPYNYVIFEGETGVGKSTLALAVAHKLKWNVQKFSASDFMEMEKCTIFDRIISQCEDSNKIIMIIEEINFLLRNYNHKYHDDVPARTLWSFLDNVKIQSNLFLIGTAGSIRGFSKQTIDRSASAIIRLEMEKDFNRIKQVLLKRLSAYHETIVVSDETKQYIDQCAKQLDGYNFWRIRNLTYEIIRQAALKMPEDHDDDESVEIKPAHIDAALKEFADLTERFKARPKPYRETEYEQRERHHREILEQSGRHYNELLAQQLQMNSISNILTNCAIL